MTMPQAAGKNRPPYQYGGLIPTFYLCPNSVTEFNYTFKWVDDSKYGARDKETGEWNGMMGELLAQVYKSNPSTRLNSKWHHSSDIVLF